MFRGLYSMGFYICSILHFDLLSDPGVRPDSGQSKFAPKTNAPYSASTDGFFRHDSSGKNRQSLLKGRGSGGRHDPAELTGPDILCTQCYFHTSRGKWAFLSYI